MVYIGKERHLMALWEALTEINNVGLEIPHTLSWIIKHTSCYTETMDS